MARSVLEAEAVLGSWGPRGRRSIRQDRALHLITCRSTYVEACSGESTFES